MVRNLSNQRLTLSIGIAALLIAHSEAIVVAQTTKPAVEPFGIEKRIPWTTSKFRGRPEPPPPFRPERLYSRLRFTTTTVLATEPGSDRMYVGEQSGKIYALPRDRDAAQASLFLDCQELVERLNRDRTEPLELEALYGMAFDPDFEKNRFCYVCYVVRRRGQTTQFEDGTRVVRLKVTTAEPQRCDPTSEQLVIAWLQGGHNGGCLRFGLDGCLYISTGDGGNAFPPDGLKAGQDLSTLLAKILRIDVRKSQPDKPYVIPADNPFVSRKGARGEIWAYGLRNPWKMSVDRKTGDLWVGDVGWELWELVYHVNKGDNFGWSIVEGSQTVHAEGLRGPTPIVPATMEIPHTDGASITGGYVYRGKKFPELDGTYIFGDWETRRIWGARIENGKLLDRQDLIDPVVRIVDFAEDSAGELYLLDHDDGSIYGLAKNDVTADANPFPYQLSETGIFESVAGHKVAPGVIEFSINSPQWSDGASAERYLAIPGEESIRMRSAAKLIPGSMFSRAVDYPRDTVLIKTLSLELQAGDPATRQRIETQVLHFDGRDWQAYTYEWNQEQTDAVLVDRRGKVRSITVKDPDAPNGKRTHQWRFAARNECIRCHNPWSEHTLAFNIAQINRTHSYGEREDNQIRALRHIHVLADIPDDPDPDNPSATLPPPRSPEQLPKLAPPFDDRYGLNDRARSYLHAHCAHCHRFNGGGSSYFFVPFDLSLRDTKAIGGRPTQGTFGIHDAQLLAPGDPYRSLIYYRMAKTGPGHMPHLGAKMIDERALPLMRAWIRQLPTRLEETVKIDQLIDLEEPRALAREAADRAKRESMRARELAQAAGRPKAENGDREAARQQLDELAARNVAQRARDRARLASELLSMPSQALLLAEAHREGRLPPGIQTLVLETALAATADPAIRDLFEAFVPEEQRTKRLGDVIDAEELLRLNGDATRGKKLFHESNVVQCRNCHRIEGKGVDLGPALDGIGKKYTPVKLLETILQPSLQIDPKYATWLVETKAGSVVVGLMVKRTESEMELRDAQNKLHRFATEEIELVTPQTKSLMPELLLREFTAQEVADLLAYLATLQTDSANAPSKQ